MSRLFHVLQSSGLVAGCLAVMGFMAGCATTPSREEAAGLVRHVYEVPQMGVPFRFIIYAPEDGSADAAAEAAFARVAELNRIMSDYETDSELSQLSYSSGKGEAVRVSDDLWNVLSFGQRISRESGGAFDMTIGPCAGLWRKARRERELPERWRVEHFLTRVGHENLVLNWRNQTAELRVPGMRLDLGGIAKGYAADAALQVLREHGFSRSLVAASGDLAIGDPPPGEAGWNVAIIGSDVPGAPETFRAVLSNAGVATSGDLEQRLEIDGVRYSHILNPFTCVGMTNHALVTVVAPACGLADPLATALTILEPAEGLAMAARHRVAARVVRLDADGLTVEENRRFKNLPRAP